MDTIHPLHSMKSPHFLLIKLYSHDICISIIVFLLQSCSISVSNVSSVSGGSATQGPTGTKYPPATWHFFRYPTMFSSENHQVSGNPKYQVPDILGIPDISGKPEHRVYIHTHTRNYPRLNKIPRYTWANISTLLPDPNPPATWLFLWVLFTVRRALGQGCAPWQNFVLPENLAEFGGSPPPPL